MHVQVEKEIYMRARRCFELLRESAAGFKDFLDAGVSASDPRYYRARNLAKEGRAYFEQTAQYARKMLGPIPIYATQDFEKWREQLLLENKVIVVGRTLESIAAELEGDEFMRGLMSPEEMRDYLSRMIDSQKSGKRKLQNIKVRMVIDRLSGLLAEVSELQKEAQKKQQGLTI